MGEPSGLNSSETSSLLGLVLRFFWMAIGNAVLFVVAILIGQQEAHRFSSLDIFYGVAVIALVGVRYVDIAFFHGSDSNGEPATLKHWRRYVLLLVLISGAGWLLAHVIAYY